MAKTANATSLRFLIPAVCCDAGELFIMLDLLSFEIHLVMI